MIVIDEALISLTVATSGEEASVLKTRAAEFQLQDRAQEHFEPAFWNRGAAAPASFTGLVSLLTVWVKLELPMTRASRFSWVAVVANTMLQTAPNAEWQTERTSSTLALHSAESLALPGNTHRATA